MNIAHLQIVTDRISLVKNFCSQFKDILIKSSPLELVQKIKENNAKS